MKQIIFLFVAVTLIATHAVSQDIITKKNGEDVLAKITEMTKSEVRYKLYDTQDGRIFTLMKSDILMIRYENGTKEIFTDTSTAPPPATYDERQRSPVQRDPEEIAKESREQKLFYTKKVEKYRKMKSTGASLTVLGVVMFGVGVGILANTTVNTSSTGATTYSGGNPDTGALALLVGMGSLGAGIPIWIVGAHNSRKYAKKMESVTVSFRNTPQSAGLSLAFHF
jgi:F0F1-type ATP synthase membrane subunit c/vacuolar-type H+-ATPase subunit K